MRSRTFFLGSLLFLSPLLLMTSCDVKDSSDRSLEKAYFDGQRDALEGDIRIKKKGDCWEWKKSPWDDGTEAKYNPKNDCKKSKD